MRSAPSEFSMACPPSMPIRQEIFPALKFRSTSAAVVAKARLWRYVWHNRCTRSICSSAEPRDVRHQLRLRLSEVHGVEPTVLADRVREIVVAVDEGDGLEERHGAGAVVLRRKARERRQGGHHEGEPHDRAPDAAALQSRPAVRAAHAWPRC